MRPELFMAWARMLAVIENAGVYRRIVSGLFADGRYSFGRIMVFFLFTKDVFKQRPQIMWQLLTSCATWR